jgi:hypothetical protein
VLCEMRGLGIGWLPLNTTLIWPRLTRSRFPSSGLKSVTLPSSFFLYFAPIHLDAIFFGEWKLFVFFLVFDSFTKSRDSTISKWWKLFGENGVIRSSFAIVSDWNLRGLAIRFSTEWIDFDLPSAFSLLFYHRMMSESPLPFFRLHGKVILTVAITIASLYLCIFSRPPIEIVFLSKVDYRLSSLVLSFFFLVFAIPKAQMNLPEELFSL